MLRVVCLMLLIGSAHAASVLPPQQFDFELPAGWTAWKVKDGAPAELVAADGQAVITVFVEPNEKAMTAADIDPEFQVFSSASNVASATALREGKVGGRSVLAYAVAVRSDSGDNQLRRTVRFSEAQGGRHHWFCIAAIGPASQSAAVKTELVSVIKSVRHTAPGGPGGARRIAVRSLPAGDEEPAAPDQEARDLAVVERAFAWQVTRTGEPPEAELREVVAHAPAELPTSFRVGGVLHVRFWDLPAFSHYVDWAKANGTAEAMKWVPNVYTRAHYLLAYILVERGQLDEAYAQLERARKLEPNHPQVLGEMGHIRHGQKRLAEALALYEAVSGVGPFVPAEKYARCLRGRGSVLMDLGLLDDAKQVLEQSLKLAPGNAIAVGELAFIEKMRQNPGYRGSLATVATQSRPVAVCSRCNAVDSAARVDDAAALAAFVCERCRQ